MPGPKSQVFNKHLIDQNPNSSCRMFNLWKTPELIKGPYGLLIVSVRVGMYAVDKEKIFNNQNVPFNYYGKQFRKLHFTGG